MAPPVFVHSWWRSASTWFWAKLRDRQGLRCYYEPLHERLGRLTPQTLRRQRVNPEKLREVGHPPLTRPYFAEFEDLLAQGARGFDPGFSYERYFLRPGDADAPLERYLRGLIQHAAAAGQRTVLCFVRSQMRAQWMRARFPGLHLAQLRNPRDQWRSFLGQGGEASYFLGGTVIIAGMLRRRCPQAFSHLFAIGGGEADFPEVTLSEKGFVARGARMSPEQQYGVFILLWLLSSLHALSAADLVLDCDRLSGDAALRAALGARLEAAGLAVDLSDAAARRYPAPANAGDLQRIEQLALRQLTGDAHALVAVDHERAAAALAQVSAESRALLEPALAALREASTSPSR